MSMLRLTCASAALVLWAGAARADEFGVMILKVEGDKVTFFKTGNTTAPVTLTLAAARGVKVVYHMDPRGLKVADDDKAAEAESGDKVEGGLKCKLFERIRNSG